MPDQLIREIPLIARYSRHNEDEDWRFRAFLKGRLNLSDTRLDEIVHETADEVWSQIDCTKCANCCKTLEIVVDQEDIALLASRLGLTDKQFRKQYVRACEDNDLVLSSVPCPFLAADNR